MTSRVTTISDRLYLVTKPSNPIWRNTTPWKARVKHRLAYFRAMFRARSSRTWSARNTPPDRYARHCYSGWYAPLVRIAEGAPAASPHRGSHPITRGWREPGRRLPARLPRKVTSSGGCQTLGCHTGCHRKPTLCAAHKALVSTEVSTVSQCFSLVECRLAKQTP